MTRYIVVLTEEERKHLISITGSPLWNKVACAPTEDEAVERLEEIIKEWCQHDSWRCDHPDRYPQDDDCPCHLLSHLKAAGIDPEPWRRKA